MKKISLIVLMLMLGAPAWSALCIKSAPVQGAEYFEFEINNIVFHVPADNDGRFVVNIESLSPTAYIASLAACNHNYDKEPQCGPPTHFLLDIRPDKLKNWKWLYYSILPEDGYNAFFISPLKASINSSGKILFDKK
jgi:hypothetical protein